MSGYSEESNTSMVPTSFACPANGCPFPCDVVRGGEATCTFHAGVPKVYWDAVTEAIAPFDAAWKIAKLHWLTFNDVDAAHEAIVALNALPIIRELGLRFRSEKEMYEIYGHGAGDMPFQILQTIMQDRIEKAIVAKRLKDYGQEERPSEAERIRSLCARIGNREAFAQGACHEEVF